MAMAKHRVVTVRMVLVSALVGVVLAVLSVPVAAIAEAYSNSGLADMEGVVEFQSCFIRVHRFDSFGHTLWLDMRHGRPMNETTSSVVDSFSRLDRDPRPALGRSLELADNEIRMVYQAGWPWLSATGFEGSAGWHGRSRSGWIKKILLPNRQRARIPVRPIWPGLLANIFFYAALAILPLATFRLWRTRRRRARGRCVSCGYELGEGVAVCPECGLAAGIAR